MQIKKISPKMSAALAKVSKKSLTEKKSTAKSTIAKDYCGGGDDSSDDTTPATKPTAVKKEKNKVVRASATGYATELIIEANKGKPMTDEQIGEKVLAKFPDFSVKNVAYCRYNMAHGYGGKKAFEESGLKVVVRFVKDSSGKVVPFAPGLNKKVKENKKAVIAKALDSLPSDGKKPEPKKLVISKPKK